jgi:hypothetical protein
MMKHFRRLEHMFTVTLGGEIWCIAGLTRESVTLNAAGRPLLMMPTGLSTVARARIVASAITQVMVLCCDPTTLERRLADLLAEAMVGVRDD